MRSWPGWVAAALVVGWGLGCGPHAAPSPGSLRVVVHFEEAATRCVELLVHGEVDKTLQMPRGDHDLQVAIQGGQELGSSVALLARGFSTDDCSGKLGTVSSKEIWAIVPGEVQTATLSLRAAPPELCGNRADDDQDGKVDCEDVSCTGQVEHCPLDFALAPANFDPAKLAQAASAPWVVDCGVTVIDSTNARVINGCGGPLPMPVVVQQAVGEALVVPVRGLTVGPTATLRLLGTRPVIFAVFGDATVLGTLSADAHGVTPGPGGSRAECGASAGGAGASPRGGGAGGGAFGSAGAVGGIGDATAQTGGAAGTLVGPALLAPLVGGCPGGWGGSFEAGTPVTPGGAGGGGLQLAVAGALVVSGRISAGGGGGLGASVERAGGGGGGSGGGLRLEARSLVVSAGARVVANGGAGAGGCASDSSGHAGEDALATVGSAQGGEGGKSGGAGGAGAALATDAHEGGGGTSEAGGGGGGGGVGRVVFLGKSCVIDSAAMVSPSPFDVGCPH